MFRKKVNFTSKLIIPLGIGLLVIVTSAIINNKTFKSFVKSRAAESGRQMKYYVVDRVRSNGDFATLAAWGINTAVVAIPTNGSASSWQSVYNAAHAANINIVIWPLDPGGDNNCGWESPFYNPVDGNYIGTVKNMLDWWANKPGVVGIVTFHEPMWESSSGCKDSISDLSAIYQQIHAYTNNPSFEIYGYVDNIVDTPQLEGYKNPADLDAIMDVAVTWQHCAGNAESACEGNSDSALSRINRDRTILTNANSHVKLVFLIQTFTAGGSYGTKFTLSELQTYSCDFLNTKALDGFGYYTWDEGWYSGNLKKWTDLQPAVSYVNTNCINNSVTSVQPTITIAQSTQTPTQRPTNTATPVPATPTLKPTSTPTPRPTSTPTPRPTNTPTPHAVSSTNTPTPSPLVTVTSRVMTPTSITYDFSRTWYGRNRVRVNIKVVDQKTNNPLSFARVSYTLTNKTTGKTWTSSGYTNFQGIVNYYLSETPNGCYTTLVTNITRYGNWTWSGYSPLNMSCY